MLIDAPRFAGLTIFTTVVVCGCGGGVQDDGHANKPTKTNQTAQMSVLEVCGQLSSVLPADPTELAEEGNTSLADVREMISTSDPPAKPMLNALVEPLRYLTGDMYRSGEAAISSENQIKYLDKYIDALGAITVKCKKVGAPGW